MATHNMPTVFPHCLCALVLGQSSAGCPHPKDLALVLGQAPVTESL